MVYINTSEYWSINNFIPALYDIIIYQNQDLNKMKIGDGLNPLFSLPFISGINLLEYNIIIHTADEWQSLYRTFIPNSNQIIIFTNLISDNKIAGLKIGDGTTYCTSLPFIYQGTLDFITNKQNQLNTIDLRQLFALNATPQIHQETLYF